LLLARHWLQLVSNPAGEVMALMPYSIRIE
jgi:hypothetical protein